jgi:hypothetical protein
VVYNWSLSVSNKSQMLYAPSEQKANETVTLNKTVLVTNASAGDADRFQPSSQLADNGAHFTSQNATISRREDVSSGVAVVAVSTFDAVYHNLTGAFRKQAKAGARSYAYSRVKTAAGTFSAADETVYFDHRYEQKEEDNSSLAGDGARSTWSVDEYANSTDPSKVNTSKISTGSNVCQADGLCDFNLTLDATEVSLPAVGIQTAVIFKKNTQGYNTSEDLIFSEEDTKYDNQTEGTSMKGTDYKMKKSLSNKTIHIIENSTASVASPAEEGQAALKTNKKRNYLVLHSDQVDGDYSGFNRYYTYTFGPVRA